MSEIVFENAKDRDGKVSKTSVYAEAAVQRVFKKGVMINSTEFTRKNLCRNLFFFFDEVKLCRYATSLKTRL